MEYYYPNCTVAVVVSTAYPLTGSFEFSRVDDGAVTTQYLNTPMMPHYETSTIMSPLVPRRCRP